MLPCVRWERLTLSWLEAWEGKSDVVDDDDIDNDDNADSAKEDCPWAWSLASERVFWILLDCKVSDIYCCSNVDKWYLHRTQKSAYRMMSAEPQKIGLIQWVNCSNLVRASSNCSVATYSHLYTYPISDFWTTNLELICAYSGSCLCGHSQQEEPPLLRMGLTLVSKLN